MPYIKKQLRERVNQKIKDLLVELKDIDERSNSRDTAGVMNYVITSLLLGIYSTDRLYQRRSYNLFNSAIGILGCVQLELYRRRIAPYEDEKIHENGDVYEGEGNV